MGDGGASPRTGGDEGVVGTIRAGGNLIGIRQPPEPDPPLVAELPQIRKVRDVPTTESPTNTQIGPLRPHRVLTEVDMARPLNGAARGLATGA